MYMNGRIKGWVGFQFLIYILSFSMVTIQISNRLIFSHPIKCGLAIGKE